jgi:hypothetical protein
METDTLDLTLIKENTYRKIPFVVQLAMFREMEQKDVFDMLKWNILTPVQLSCLTGKEISTIENMTRPRFQDVDGKMVPVSKLQVVYPWRSPEGRGPKFILYDDNLHEYIQSLIEKR